MITWRMRMVAAITDQAPLKIYFEWIVLDSEIHKLKPPRSPPQTEFDLEYGA
jgi:hypothetical protein